MLFVKEYGVVPVLPDACAAYPPGTAMSAAAACGFGPDDPCDFDNKLGGFAYSFPEAEGLPETAGTTAALDALASQMIDTRPSACANSTIPPVFAFMGEFIGHDIAAVADREAGVSLVDGDRVAPLSRTDVQRGLANLRFGRLSLDAVYGGAPVQGPLARALTRALRCPDDPARLAAGPDGASAFAPIPVPRDAARDLPRLGRARAQGQITDADLARCPEDMRAWFFDPDGGLRDPCALIGDFRNDETLGLAQFHLAMIRLHNKIVDAVPLSVPRQDRSAVFSWARQATEWVWQWLVMHAYLPAVCDAETLAMVQYAGTPLYAGLVGRTAAAPPGTLPLPLEFSEAAFCLGPTMARAAYDWNRNYGRGDAPIAPRARLQDLYRFASTTLSEPQLPRHWLIEQERFVYPPDPETPDRSASPIDTRLVSVSSGVGGEAAARRLLRRGYRLNLPTAQACLAALSEAYGFKLAALSPEQIASGQTGAVVRAGGFETRTPLWFYVLKEADVLGGGNRLGPLGTVLVADTLIGLLRHDPDSFVNAAPGGAGWVPEHTVVPGGVVIEDMPSMMRAAGLM